MKHWTEYDPKQKIRTTECFGCNYRLWNWIDQTRGDKSRSQYIRDILTKVMNTPKWLCRSCGHIQEFGELRGLLPVCEKCGGHVFTAFAEEKEVNEE